MAKGYRPVSRDQPFLLPPDMRDWLAGGHLAWFVIEAVGALDLSRFAAGKTPRGSLAGRAAYDPRVLLGLLVYGYATGVRSSRRIERACEQDVAFRVICAQDVPDHATIARFRRERFADPGAVEGLFAQVLVLAARAGLGRLGLIALDGTKIAASASKDANRTEERLGELARQILAEAEAVDGAEDELYGDARGDELPPELADPVTRRERITAAVEGLRAEREQAGRDERAKAAQFRARRASGRRTGPAPLAAAVALARENLDRATAAQQARIDDWQARDNAARSAGGKGLDRRTRPRSPASEHVRVRQAAARLEKAKARAAEAERTAAGRQAARKGPGPVANITDPHSHLMPVRGGGFIQGYNAQAARSADGLCLGVMVTAQTTDYSCFPPMLEKITAAGGILRAHARGPLKRLAARTGIVLADAGYLSQANLTCPGPDRLIATGKTRNLTAGPARSGGTARSQAVLDMAARLASYPANITYRQRGPIAEGHFGNTKHNHGFRRFSMRGMARVNGEWTFQNTIENLLKIHATGWQPA